MDNTPPSGQLDAPNEPRPGDTITPAALAIDHTPSTEAAPAVVASAQPQPALQPQAAAVPETPSVAVSSPQLEVVAPAGSSSPFQSDPEQPPSAPLASRDDGGAISWTAAEFIAHQKSIRWYGILAGAVILLAIIVYLFTRDKISTTVVVVAGAALGAYGARQPQQRRYMLDEQGLTIADRYLPYDEFRSFSVIDEGAVSSISFFPLKRFGQLTTIYYNPEDEPAIIGLLSERLPMDDRSHDLVDRFMKRIRF